MLRPQARARDLYRVALLTVRSPWDAEEVVASAFLELWRKREHVRIVDGSVLPWLLTVVAFMAKNHLRGTRRYQKLLAKIPAAGVEPDRTEEIDRMVDALPVTNAVKEALMELNARDASVVLLCIVEELSVREAATVLGVPEGTVKSRLSRAKSRLRIQLGQYSSNAGGATA